MFLADVATWSEVRLRMAQDCLLLHGQQLASVVRLRRNADKQWGAVVAREAERKSKRDEEYAAAAPARAASVEYQRERKRAERARAPPPTRASHPTPAFVNHHLGHVGGKGVGLAAVAAAPPPPLSPIGPSVVAVGAWPRSPVGDLGQLDGGAMGGLVVLSGGHMAPVIPTLLDMGDPEGEIPTFEEWFALEYPEERLQ